MRANRGNQTELSSPRVYAWWPWRYVILNMLYVFLIPLSVSRLLQWIVEPTTPGKSEGYRTLRATRSSRVHNVSSGGHDPVAAQESDRYRMRSERRVTRIPAGLRARERRSAAAFSSRVTCTIPAPHSGERTPDEAGARGTGAIQLRRCAATSCRRRAILSSKDRIGYPPVPEWPCAPVPCGTRAMLHWTRRPPCVTQMPPHESPCAGIHKGKSEGVTRSVDVRERAFSQYAG